MLPALFSARKTRRFDFAIPMPDLNQYMTVEEAAQKLGFHPETVRRLLRDKILDGLKWRREWLALRESVEKYSQDFGDNKHNSRRK